MATAKHNKMSPSFIGKNHSHSLFVTRHPVEGVDELHLSHPLNEILVVGDDQKLEVALHPVALSKSAKFIPININNFTQKNCFTQ
jgi:hypothetical protein